MTSQTLSAPALPRVASALRLVPGHLLGTRAALFYLWTGGRLPRTSEETRPVSFLDDMFLFR